jgi:hypothetical protein
LLLTDRPYFATSRTDSEQHPDALRKQVGCEAGGDPIDRRIRTRDGDLSSIQVTCRPYSRRAWWLQWAKGKEHEANRQAL